MFTWTITFLILAVAAWVLGFSSLAGAAASIAQILFVLFLGLMVISFLKRQPHGRGH
jgi:uncharacterized membrane protein YtjA (UPF0391 family)